VESNLITDAEKIVDKVLPRDLPSDTREVAALAEEAAKGITEIDPAFAPVLTELDNAVKGFEGAFDFLKSKVEKVKAAATVTTPAPAPVEPLVDGRTTTPAEPTAPLPEPIAAEAPPTEAPPAAPAETSPATESGGTEAVSTDPTPPVAESTAPEPVDPTLRAAASSSPLPTTEASPSAPADAAGDDPPTAAAMAAFKTLTPAEQAQFLMDLASGAPTS
jgi:hypothetical protein